MDSARHAKPVSRHAHKCAWLHFCASKCCCQREDHCLARACCGRNRESLAIWLGAGSNDPLIYMTCRGRLTDAEASSDDRGQLGLEQPRLVLRHGCFYSLALHHIDSRHVSACIVLPPLPERDVYFQVFPLLHAAHKIMEPAMCKRRRRQVQIYLFNRLALRLLHVMAYAGPRGNCWHSTERLLRLICHSNMMRGM